MAKREFNHFVTWFYIFGQLLFRAVLFTRDMYYYDWTNTKELALIICMVLFLLVHYSSAAMLQKQGRFLSRTNNVLLGFELVFCLLWGLSTALFALAGIKYSNFIFLNLAFNLLPMALRLIAIRIIETTGNSSAALGN